MSSIRVFLRVLGGASDETQREDFFYLSIARLSIVSGKSTARERNEEKMKQITMIATIMVGGFVFADWISDESMERAASSWLSSDRVAQLTMKDLSFDRLIHRGSLRIACLSPSGRTFQIP